MSLAGRLPGALDGATAPTWGPPHVKFCGMTRPADAERAAAFGASAIGLVLWAGSPRGIEIDRAREVARAVPPGVLRVGVFVNALPDLVRRACAEIPLDVVQLHGDEPVEWLGAFTRPLLKAVAGDEDADREWLAVSPHLVTLLVDAADPLLRGGTGRQGNWEAARGLARRRPVVLAGGLHPANVGRAIAEVGPYGVDVSSGVEASPGVKDHVKMQAFIEAVRATAAAGQS